MRMDEEGACCWSLAATWKHEEEMDGGDELHHSISQELQPLVVRNLKESKL